MTPRDQYRPVPAHRLLACFEDWAGGSNMKKFIELAERGLVVLAIFGVITMIVTHKPVNYPVSPPEATESTAAEIVPQPPATHHLSSR